MGTAPEGNVQKYSNGEKIRLPKEAIEERIEKLKKAGFVFELVQATWMTWCVQFFTAFSSIQTKKYLNI